MSELGAITLTEEGLREFRKRLDGISSDIKGIRVAGEGQPALMTLAWRSVDRARRWVGQHLKERGTSNPYPESMNPANTIIDPRADENTNWASQNTGEAVADIKANRGLLEAYSKTCDTWQDHTGSRAMAEVSVSLIDAKMYLGEVLGLIRDSVPVPA